MKINKFVAYLLGLILLSFGITMAVKANYGVTVATSPSFVLSLQFVNLSFGVFNYLIQGFVFLLIIVVLRRFEISYLFSFGTSILFGYTIDFFVWIMQNVAINSHPIRILYFIVSIIIISAGLVFFYRSKMPILPFDIFVREVSKKFNIKISRFKMGFDISMCTIAVIMSLVFFKELRGISFGTFISALTIGPLIGLLMISFDKIFTVSGSD